MTDFLTNNLHFTENGEFLLKLWRFVGPRADYQISG